MDAGLGKRCSEIEGTTWQCRGMRTLEEIVPSCRVDGHLAVFLARRRSFLSIMTLSSLQICRPESFTGWPQWVCACLRLTLPNHRTDHLDPHSQPEPSRRRLCRQLSLHLHPFSVFLEAFIFQPHLPRLSLVCVFARMSPTVEGARARVKSSEGDTLCLVPR